MFEEFPAEEYQLRLSRMREVMKGRNIDALLVTTGINGRYPTGLVNNYWVSTMVDDAQAALIPGDVSAERVLVLADHICGGAMGASAGRKCRTVDTAIPQRCTQA